MCIRDRLSNMSFMHCLSELWEGHLEASSRAPWRPSGGILEASWGLVGDSGGRLEVKQHFGGLEFCGMAVLKPSWGRFLSSFRPFWNNF